MDRMAVLAVIIGVMTATVVLSQLENSLNKLDEINYVIGELIASSWVWICV
jgi:phosphatidylglycerophosphatase A